LYENHSSTTKITETNERFILESALTETDYYRGDFNNIREHESMWCLGGEGEETKPKPRLATSICPIIEQMK
jgi:hypothetical protein